MLAACISPSTAGSILSYAMAAGPTHLAPPARRMPTPPVRVGPAAVDPRPAAGGDPLGDMGILIALTPPAPAVARRPATTHSRPATNVEALFRPASPATRPPRSLTVFDWAGVALTVDARSSDGCRWPSGDPRRDEDFSYCGRPSVGGKSYCAEHCARAYQPQKSSARLPPRVA